MRKWWMVVCCLVVIALVLIVGYLLRPRTGHLTLLTVQQLDNGTRGGTADVYLTITPGTGQTYLATYPFAKLDTQISTRFAKEVACSFVGEDCDRYDFFYLIRADSSIIGGPSAGAAIASLTAALLDRQSIDQGVAVTGTISAGGIVGPVGGVDEKVFAAADNGLHTVVIPRWTAGNQTNSTNASFPQDLSVIEATRLDEVLLAVTGKRYPVGQDLDVPVDYEVLMGAVADQLCARSEELQVLLGESNESLYIAGMDFLDKAAAAAEVGASYSRASYCFSANLRLRELQMASLQGDALDAAADEVSQKIDAAMIDLAARPLQTFTDLQTRAIVDDRLREAKDYLVGGNVSSADVAYALERYRSALIWSNFFSLPGEPLQLDDLSLRAACEEKLAEVEERFSYLTLLFGDGLLDEASLDDAYAMYAADDYALCLFKASTAKAEADVVLSSIAVSEEEFPALVDEQLTLARAIIARESSHDRFPIMGYSYYEYASSLQADDPYTASLFASYALELGDLRMYFSADERLNVVRLLVADRFFRGLVIGLVLAVLLASLWMRPAGRQKKRARRKA